MKMIFLVPQVLMIKFYYDDSMPPFYDDYVDESGFGEVMTLFSDESTISEEVPDPLVHAIPLLNFSETY